LDDAFLSDLRVKPRPPGSNGAQKNVLRQPLKAEEDVKAATFLHLAG